MNYTKVDAKYLAKLAQDVIDSIESSRQECKKKVIERIRCQNLRYSGFWNYIFRRNPTLISVEEAEIIAKDSNHLYDYMHGHQKERCENLIKLCKLSTDETVMLDEETVQNLYL